MWRITGVILVVVSVLGVQITPGMAQAQTSEMLIVAVQTASTKSASDEVITIANTSNSNINLQGWSLGYFSAQPASFTKPSRTLILQGSVPASAEYTLATITSAVTALQTFSATLAASGGHLALYHGTEQVDLVGWGSASRPLGSSAPAPAAGHTLVRLKNDQGEYLNTDNNGNDFAIQNNVSTVITAEGKDKNTLHLHELLPNPSEPTPDSEGEYVELWNSSSSPFNLQGYVLLAGPSLGKRYTFGEELLGPTEYRAFYSKQTKLSLGNNGSRVQLQAPDGTVLGDLTYDQAREGQAWAWDGATWQWTNTPTPNSDNIFTVVAVPQTAEKVATKKVTTPKKSTKKSAGPSRSGSVKAAATTRKTPARQQSAAPVHNGIVAGVGGLAVLYGLYEYRRDLAHFIRKFRGNRKIG